MSHQIVVSGGAGFWCGPDGLALDRFVLSLSGKSKPRVCYIATAAGDSEEFIQGFYDSIGPIAEATHLPLFLPPFVEPEEALADQDVIYVSGGSTVNMLVVWRLHGIDKHLSNALDSGTILYGSSAGGLCWFQSGSTDSLGFDDVARPLKDGLGFLSGSHCPHFDVDSRRLSYEAMVGVGDLADGVGVDEFAAVHFVDGEIVQTVTSVLGNASYRVRRCGDKATVARLETKTVLAP